MTNVLITQLLKEIGLTENETKVYLILNIHGPLTYNKTAELTGINRTTCYAVAKRLIEHGLVLEDLGNAVVRLVSRPTSALEDKLTKEQAVLVKRFELAKRVSSEIQKLIPQQVFGEPKIRHISEEDITEYLYKRADTWDKSMRQYDMTMWGFQDSIFEGQFQDYILWYWTRPLSKGMQLKMFSDDPSHSKTFTNPSPSRVLKYWPEIVSFSASTWVYGDYVVVLSIQERPNYLLEIYEPLLATNMRTFFKAIWDSAEKTPRLPT